MRARRLLVRWAVTYAACSVLLWVGFSVVAAYWLDDAQGTPLTLRTALLGGALVLALGALGWILWKPVGESISRIDRAVKAYAAGDFNVRLPCQDGSEISLLSADLNWMAQQFQDRIAAENARHREEEAVLSSMQEGVIAVDSAGRFIKVNRVARDWLGLENVEWAGQSTQEVMRQSDLQQFIRIALSSNDYLKADIELQGAPRRQVQVNSAPLKEDDGARLGALIMLNDITHMRRLESLRRDFVANVSHELKTPITSIKGFMETLLDGAIDNPVDARRFLEIIAKQADRLDAIIEDLLSLSRIEQDSERGELSAEQAGLKATLQAAVQAMQSRAEAKNIQLVFDCPDKMTARINAPLIEQAATNLIDNAIKYSGEDTVVHVRAREENGRALVEVSDQGPGIAREHQARIFERFYRVDKSRSRRLGGTGLGLSIVKHITQAHGGTIAVHSEPGNGSTFVLSLPQ